MSYCAKAPVNVIGGYNAVPDNAELLSQFGKSCLIVTGSTAAKKSGALDDVEKALVTRGIEYSVFDGVTENPPTEVCFEAGRQARENKADFIIGIGGGSALDAAKAVAVYATNPQISSADLIYSEPVANKPLPVVLVGTTAGTGSEVTGVSVLTDTKGKKKSVKGENYYAALVFADAKYTCSLPFAVTVSTALDALCHATESFFSSRSEEQSVKAAETAIPLIWNELTGLEKSGKLPDREARERLFDGSIYAGAAINITGCGFPHTVGYYLTEKHGIPHGRACAVFLPAFVGRGIRYLPEKAERYFDLIGTDPVSFEKTVLSLADVNVKIDSSELEAYLKNWQSAPNFDKSPGGFDAQQAKELIIRLFE
jgi:alcohol dehydrogenase class IV